MKNQRTFKVKKVIPMALQKPFVTQKLLGDKRIEDLYSRRMPIHTNQNYFSLNNESRNSSDRDTLSKRSISVKEREEYRNNHITNLHPIKNKSKAVNGFLKQSNLYNDNIKRRFTRNDLLSSENKERLEEK